MTTNTPTQRFRPRAGRRRIGSLAPLMAVAFVASASDLDGQEVEVEAGGWAASGSGPTPSVAFGLDVHVGIPWVGVVGELSRWDAWGVDCIGLFPDRLRCDAGGTAILGGLRVIPPQQWPIRPYTEAKLGRFGSSPAPPGDRRAARSLEVGARFDLSRFFSLEIGARGVWVDDPPYEEAIGEDIQYSMLNLRFLARVR